MKRNGKDEGVTTGLWIRLLLCIILSIDVISPQQLKIKSDLLPVHVEQSEETLIWAIQVNSNFYPESKNDVPKNGVFSFNEENGEDICDSTTKEIARKCSLLCRNKLDFMDNVYIFVFKIPTQVKNEHKSRSPIPLRGNYSLINQSTSDHQWNIPVYRVHKFHSDILNANDQKVIGHDVNQCLDDHPHVKWYSQQHIRRREKRSHLAFSDPYYPQQWHLRNLWHKKMDINVTGVWEKNVTGQGVTVAVVDDGLEWTNKDLNGNYNKEGSWDLNSNDPDPMPSEKEKSNHHGTRCAGEIAAVKNDYCAVGVAYDAKVSGIRVLDGPMTDSLEAQAFTTNLQINDIFSCSWGPDDDGKTVDGPHVLAKSAISFGIDFGRHGYGSIYVVASGNGGRFHDNCNFDGYANSVYTVTIGAVDETGHMPYYAEECAAMLAVTFSSGSGTHRSIVTTDWTKDGGTGCTTSHTGTSAAAPIAAGMIALMLQVRPCLTWRDVQYLIILTAQKIDVDEAHWQKNKAGLFHSNKHGFGLMKAWKLVNAAKIWEMVPWITSYLHSSDDINMQIPKGQHNPLILTYEVTEQEIRGYDLFSLENVLLTVTLTHPCRGMLEIILICPSGTRSMIAAPRKLDNSSVGFYKWTFSTVRCWGEAPVGNWTFIFKDTDSHKYGPGYLKYWKLKLMGTPMSQGEFQNRRRRVANAMDGKYLNDSYSLPCPPPPVTAKPDVPMPEKTLKFIILAGAFAFILAVYETFEYAACYHEEKKEQRRKMRHAARTNNASRQDAGCYPEDSESQGLLAAEEEMIHMEELNTNNVRETTLDSGEITSMDTGLNNNSTIDDSSNTHLLRSSSDEDSSGFGQNGDALSSITESCGDHVSDNNTMNSEGHVTHNHRVYKENG